MDAAHPIADPAEATGAAQDAAEVVAFDPSGREYPYYDTATASMVLKHTADGQWMVSVAPMIFNDRVLLTHRGQWPMQWTAGWCFPKGGAAPLAAMAWDPDRDREPVGYIKVAADPRPH